MKASLDEDVDGEILQILDDLLNLSEGSGSTSQSYTTSESRSTVYFFSETITNLSYRVLTDPEMKILEQGTGFALIQRKINDQNLSRILMTFVEECA